MDPHRGDGPGIEPRLAVQQADALLSELRRTLLSYVAPYPLRKIKFSAKKCTKSSLTLKIHSPNWNFREHCHDNKYTFITYNIHVNLESNKIGKNEVLRLYCTYKIRQDAGSASPITWVRNRENRRKVHFMSYLLFTFSGCLVDALEDNGVHVVPL